MQHSATHPSDSATAVPREQNWAAFLLAWVAAFSDAIGYLVFPLCVLAVLIVVDVFRPFEA